MSEASFPEQWISAWIDGELTPDERARFEAWIADQPELARLAVQLREQRDALRNAPRHQLPTDFADRLLQSVEFTAARDSRAEGSQGFGEPSSPSPYQAGRSAWQVTDWNTALAAIASLAALILITLIVPGWKGLRPSGTASVARRSDESAAHESFDALPDSTTDESITSGRDSAAGDVEVAEASMIEKESVDGGVAAASKMAAGGDTAVISGAEPFVPGKIDSRPPPAIGKLAGPSRGNGRGRAKRRSQTGDSVDLAESHQPQSNRSAIELAMDEPGDAAKPPATAKSQMVLPAPATQAEPTNQTPAIEQQAARNAIGAGDEEALGLDQSANKLVDAVAQDVKRRADRLNVVHVELPDSKSLGYLNQVLTSNSIQLVSPESEAQEGLPESDAASDRLGDGDDAFGNRFELADEENRTAGALTNQAMVVMARPEQMQQVVVDLSRRVRVELYEMPMADGVRSLPGEWGSEASQPDPSTPDAPTARPPSRQPQQVSDALLSRAQNMRQRIVLDNRATPMRSEAERAGSKIAPKADGKRVPPISPSPDALGPAERQAILAYFGLTAADTDPNGGKRRAEAALQRYILFIQMGPQGDRSRN